MQLPRTDLAVALLISASWQCLGTMGNSIDRSCADRDFLTDTPSEDIRAVVSRGQKDFSVNLIKSLFNQTEGANLTSNIFISPSSIFQSLTLAFFGAAGVTESELAKVLGVESVDKEMVKKAYVFDRAFQAVREKNPDLEYKLLQANRMFFDRSLPLDKCLTLLLNNELGAVNFAENPEKARQQINEWVEEKTLNKIRNLLPEGSVDGSTKLSLTNAAYFKGMWKSQFKPNDTRMDNFYVSRNQITVTKFMKQKGQFQYYLSEQLRAHVVELPYVGDSISMLIILPPFEAAALKTTVSRMTPENIQGVVDEIKSGYYEVDGLDVQIPRFNIEQSMELSGTLGGLGLESLFDSTSTNLTKFLSPNSSDMHLSLQSAVHKSFIEVNEEGSEAAAATALFGFRSARPLFHKQFIANHPFMFFIYDKETDTILFFGVMQDPTSLV